MNVIRHNNFIMDDLKLAHLKWNRLAEKVAKQTRSSETHPIFKRLKGRTLRFLERDGHLVQDLTDSSGEESLIWSQTAPEEILKNLPQNKYDKAHVLFLRLSRVFTAGVLFKKVSALHWVIEKIFVDGRFIHIEEDEYLRKLPDHVVGDVLLTEARKITSMVEIEDLYKGEGATAYLVALTNFHTAVLMSALPKKWLGDYLQLLAKQTQTIVE